MKTTQVEKLPFYGDKLSDKINHWGLSSPDSMSEKITEDEQSPLRRRQLVWKNHSEQKIDKTFSKLAPSPKKRNTSHISKSL